MSLTATIDGRQVPLDECVWVERSPCGCVASWVLAVATNWTLATEEQAAAHMRTARGAGGDVGRFELIAVEDYREHIGSRWECLQHTRPGVAR